MTTERLFYADAYLREFPARVVAKREFDGRPAVALDRTAFYPTGGGQPADAGWLAPAGERDARVRVVDTVLADDQVWHVLAGPVAEGDVRGEIDWGRRFDHMQQHTGQHILSQSFIVTCNAETVAFHLGADACTIDLNRNDLSQAEVDAAEAAANGILDAALPVTAGFVTEEELAALPLRRAPKVSEKIRVVQVAGFDWSPCGGTHVANAAQVGLIKVIGAERRGTETRISFLCGARARADYGRLQVIAQGLVARFTTSQDELLEAVDRRAAEAQAMRKDLEALEGQWVAATAAALAGSAEIVGQWRLVVASIDAPFDRVKRLATALRAQPGTAIFLATPGEKPQLACTRADDVKLDAGAVLREAATAGGGRGGGRPDWAQGGVPSAEGLSPALEAARAAIRKAAGA